MVAQQDLDATRRAYEVAKSQYQAAREDAGVKRDYSFVKAPFDGVIAKKYTEVGELLMPGKQIVTIVNPDRIYVLATIDEVDVGRLKIGQPVAITVDAFPGEKFGGTVRRISPIVSGGKLETRTADVWIYFDKKDARMKSGMSADVEILITDPQGRSFGALPGCHRTRRQEAGVYRGGEIRQARGYGSRTAQAGRDRRDQLELYPGHQRSVRWRAGNHHTGGGRPC